MDISDIDEDDYYTDDDEVLNEDHDDDNDETNESISSKSLGRSDTSLEQFSYGTRPGIQPAFNEAGQLLQVQYANVCASKGEPSVAVVAQNGVVLVTQKKLGNILIESDSTTKIEDVAENIGITYSGLACDFRQVIRKARKIATTFKVNQACLMPVMSLPHDLGKSLQEFTQTFNVRPYGLLLFIAGWHKNRGFLYRMNCVGSYQAVQANAIGCNSSACNAYLQRNYSKTIFLEPAICLAIQTLKLACGNNQIGANQLNLAYVDADGFHQMTEEDIKYILRHLR